jgi:hypothetical protein
MQIVLKRGSSGYPCPQLRHEPTWLLIDAPASTTCAVAETYDVELGVFQQAEHHVGRRLFACIFPAELLLSKPDRERSDAFGETSACLDIWRQRQSPVPCALHPFRQITI